MKLFLIVVFYSLKFLLLKTRTIRIANCIM